MIGVLTVTSRYVFAETIRQLTSAIEAGGGTLFASIDQTAAAAAIRLDLRPTTLIVFGNPRIGTPLMQACPMLGLDLPLRLLIWEASGVVTVAYVPMSVLAERYGLRGEHDLLAAADRVLTAVTGSVSQPVT